MVGFSGEGPSLLEWASGESVMVRRIPRKLRSVSVGHVFVGEQLQGVVTCWWRFVSCNACAHIERANGFVVVFAVHDLKEFVNTGFGCFKFVFFGCEKEEAALELRPRGGLNTREELSSIVVFDCHNHFWESVWFSEVVCCSWGVRNVDSGDEGAADEVCAQFAVLGVESGSHGVVTAHNLLLLGQHGTFSSRWAGVTRGPCLHQKKRGAAAIGGRSREKGSA